ncbi:MAG: sensor histidine kinase [Acidimicrobiia bacterium]
MSDFDLRTVPLFSRLSDADIERLGEGLTELTLSSGTALFDEGDIGDMAYVIADGELEILKESGGNQVRIAVSGPGDVVGEMSLLTAEPRSATARARSDTRLVAIPKSCLDDVLGTSVEANQALFDVFIARWREQESRVRQSERMAQIGVLTAGLAHEMNNPAAAVASASERLSHAVEARVESIDHLPPQTTMPVPTATDDRLSAMERSEAEESIEDLLENLDVSEPWRHATAFVDAGFTAEDLSALGEETAQVIVEALSTQIETDALVAEIHEGARRLSELVGALKSYSFLDQAPVQQVDVTKGIDDTLLILRSKTKDIPIERDYHDSVPPITAYGSQLNQVWTNLIDNAADAIHDADLTEGAIRIRVFAREDSVVVEVENDGPTIPPDVVDRIFEAFYTTKEPGKGTGLGLDTAYSIVVTQHGGSLTVTSGSGITVFTVVLPIEQETTAG